MTGLSITLGDAPLSEGSHNRASLRDSSPENLLEQSLQRLDVSVLASQLADASVWVPMDLAAFVPALMNNASVSVRVFDAANLATFQPIHTAFLLAGLKQTTELKRAHGSIT